MSSCLITIKGRAAKADKKAFLMKDGENLLEKLISASNGKYNPIRSFYAKELKTATNNYDTRNVITRDRLHELFKGFLEDHHRPISVMKFTDYMDACVSEDIRLDAYEFCFNFIAFASQMCHKNILKLIGCCLETQIPILVFEYAQFGTLADRIYRPDQLHFEPLLWTHRLKIAMEIANALTYLHIGFSRPIVFRNIKLLNILFDKEYVVKLFDFCLSVSIPEDETHVQDQVIGAMGFIAPEYMNTGDFNEKSDVFSFGVLLLAILTGKRITDSSRLETGGEYDLLDHVKKYNENGRLEDLIDHMIAEDVSCSRKDPQLKAFTAIAFKCVSESEEERPTMIDVAKQLRQMYKFVC